MSRKLISFDWAMKRLLRSKAHFGVLEGFLSELLNDDIMILEVLESEANQAHYLDKFNRVDLKVRNKQQEVLIIEIQYDREIDYFQRILYASSKVITEHLRQGDSYQHVIKVISINILYFNLGEGDDYIYHGSTRFTGLHHQDELRLTTGQQRLFGKNTPQALFTEYYLIRVNKFNDITKNSLDEWVYFFKHEEIKENFNAKGLKQAKQELDLLKLSTAERQAYNRYMEDKSYQASMYESTYLEGRQEGRLEEKYTMVRLMKKNGEPLEKIQQYTQLPLNTIEQL